MFQCRDEGPLRARVEWRREGGQSLPLGATNYGGRLEMPNIQIPDSGNYICEAIDYLQIDGSSISVNLRVKSSKSRSKTQ